MHMYTWNEKLHIYMPHRRHRNKEVALSRARPYGEPMTVISDVK